MLLLIYSLTVCLTPASQGRTDQLFYLRFVPNLKASEDELTKGVEGASYKAIFGRGDRNAESLHGIERFGELTVEPGGRSARVAYPSEEQIYYVVEGAGSGAQDRARGGERELGGQERFTTTAHNTGCRRTISCICRSGSSTAYRMRRSAR